MYPIHEILSKQILELQLREAAEDVVTNEYLSPAEISKLLLEAAESIKIRDKELWAINEELVKAGLKTYEHETFAKCVALLRECGLTSLAVDGANAFCKCVDPHFDIVESCSVCGKPPRH